MENLVIDPGRLIVDSILLLIGVFTGIGLAFGQGWVQEFFDKRKKIDDFIGKVVDEVAETTSSDYRRVPSVAVVSGMMKAAAQLERLGKVEYAKKVRAYTNTWGIYYHTTMDYKRAKRSEEYDVKAANIHRGHLDRLTDELMGNKALPD